MGPTVRENFNGCTVPCGVPSTLRRHTPYRAPLSPHLGAAVGSGREIRRGKGREMKGKGGTRERDEPYPGEEEEGEGTAVGWRKRKRGNRHRSCVCDPLRLLFIQILLKLCDVLDPVV